MKRPAPLNGLLRTSDSEAAKVRGEVASDEPSDGDVWMHEDPLYGDSLAAREQQEHSAGLLDEVRWSEEDVPLFGGDDEGSAL
jgi:hypothetical protein